MARKKKARGETAIQTVQEPAEAAKKGGDRTKGCPGCGAKLGYAVRRCPQCGYPFGKRAEAEKAKAEVPPVAEKPPAAPAKPRMAGDATSALFAAKDFAEQVGGIDQAISLLEVVKKIRE